MRTKIFRIRLGCGNSRWGQGRVSWVQRTRTLPHERQNKTSRKVQDLSLHKCRVWHNPLIATTPSTQLVCIIQMCRTEFSWPSCPRFNIQQLGQHCWELSWEQAPKLKTWQTPLFLACYWNLKCFCVISPFGNFLWDWRLIIMQILNTLRVLERQRICLSNPLTAVLNEWWQTAVVTWHAFKFYCVVCRKLNYISFFL